MISSQNIAKAVVSLSREKNHTPEKISEQILYFIKKYNLQTQLAHILKYIQREAEIEKKAHTLFIQSPHVIDHATIQTISRFVNIPTGSVIHQEKNPALIGGFLAYWKDTKIDGSINNALKHLEKDLLSV